jgi:homogentisate 1,2-dioxygenase
MLFVPQQGRLDIQTEFGRLMARPGEIVVIQRGMRFGISLPDGPSRGYIQEIFVSGTYITLEPLSDCLTLGFLRGSTMSCLNWAR